MKLILIIPFVAISIFSFGQKMDSIPKTSDGFMYEGIVKLDTTFSKEKLYRNAKVFFVDNFKSANDVIQYDDKNEGKIIGKGLFLVTGVQKQNLMYSSDITWKVYFSTEIICKNAKYKYKIYDISINENSYWQGDGSETNRDITIEDVLSSKNKKQIKCYQSMYKDAVIQFNQTISSLKDYMNKQVSKDDF